MKRRIVMILLSTFVFCCLSIFVQRYTYTQRQEAKNITFSDSTVTILNNLTDQASTFNQRIRGLATQAQDATVKKKKDIIVQAKNDLAQFADLLKNIDKEALALPTDQLYTLLNNTGEGIEIIAKAQLKPDVSLETNRQFFKNLLDAGLNIQLILLYRIPQWAKKLDDASRENISQFLGAAQRVISNSLYLISHSYQEQAQAAKGTAKDNLLMLANVLIYSIASFDREPYKAFDSASAAILRENIGLEQTEAQLKFLRDLGIEVALKYPDELQTIYGG